MKIAVLGYGVEGRSVEKYFQRRGDEVEVFNKMTAEALKKFPSERYDLVFRSPSVRPWQEWTSITKYFMERCPCPIIGVTGTKGKGTTCSLIAALLREMKKKVFLVGNIGLPALDVLDEIKLGDFCVYEMSSFQLWDVEKSPKVSVILRIEPDHLDVHRDLAEYVAAKANIAKYQTEKDLCVYYKNNQRSREIAKKIRARKIAYPLEETDLMREALGSLRILGKHNQENAMAALAAVSGIMGMEVEEFLRENLDQVKRALSKFEGLPHHVEIVKQEKNITYYDDNYSTAFASLDVALAAVPEEKVVLIAGGKDKGIDLTDIKNRIFGDKKMVKVILIGETASKIAEGEDKEKYEIADSLEEAVQRAQVVAVREAKKYSVAMLMSPACASLDMFESYSKRGEEFQRLVKELE